MESEETVYTSWFRTNNLPEAYRSLLEKHITVGGSRITVDNAAVWVSSSSLTERVKRLS